MAKKKDYLDQLAEAAEELNEVLGLEPPIDTDGVTKSVLEEKIIEASELLAEEDEISKSTRTILDSLLSPDEDEEEEADLDIKGDDDVDEEEEDDEDIEDPSLAEVVQATKKRKDLKALAKSEPEFAGIKNKISKLKTADELREVMLEALESGKKPEPKKVPKAPEKPTPKAKEEAPEKPAPKKAPKARSKYSRGQSLKDALASSKKGLTRQELMEKSDSLYADKGGESNMNGAKAMVDIHLPVLILFEAVEEKDGRFTLTQ